LEISALAELVKYFKFEHFQIWQFKSFMQCCQLKN